MTNAKAVNTICLGSDHRAVKIEIQGGQIPKTQDRKQQDTKPQTTKDLSKTDTTEYTMKAQFELTKTNQLLDR